MKISKDIIVMAEEPAKDLTIEYANKMAHAVTEETEIAQLYASVHNKAWWVADEEYDYEEGTAEYQKAKELTNKWFAVESNLRKKILKILKEEGVSIPVTGQIEVLRPFMERNGYEDGNGWWFPADEI